MNDKQPSRLRAEMSISLSANELAQLTEEQRDALMHGVGRVVGATNPQRRITLTSTRMRRNDGGQAAQERRYAAEAWGEALAGLSDSVVEGDAR